MRKNRMFRYLPVMVPLLLATLFVAACGDDRGDVEGSDDIANCQAACEKRMRCDGGAAMDAAMLDDCREHCVFADHPAEAPAEEAHILCHLEYELCEDFNACVERVTGYEEGTFYPQFCQDWCSRCLACMEADAEFSDGMCRDADGGDDNVCLTRCKEQIEDADERCERLFDLYDPANASCDDMVADSPFDQGC